MSKQYGKIPRSTGHKKAAPPSELLIAIHDRHTLEQLSEKIQIAIARLQDHGVHGVQKFRIRLEPLDEKGEAKALWDSHGNPVPVIQIPEPPIEPPYRLK